jgi:hypothetical protein
MVKTPDQEMNVPRWQRPALPADAYFSQMGAREVLDGEENW